MNDNDIANYMQNMPADMVAESAKYAPGSGAAAGAARAVVNNVGRTSWVKNKFSIAAAVLLFLVGLGAAIIVPMSLKNKRPDTNEPVLTATDEPTALPAETATPSEPAASAGLPGVTATPAETPNAAETPAVTATPSVTQTPAVTATLPVTRTQTPTVTATPPVTQTPTETATPPVTRTPTITPTPGTESLYNLSKVVNNGALTLAGLSGGAAYKEQNMDEKLAEFEAYIQQRISSGAGSKYSDIQASIIRLKALGFEKNSSVVSNGFVDANMIVTDSFVLLSADGHYYMPLDDASVRVTSMVSVDYDHNGVSDLVMSAVASPSREMLLVFDRTAKEFKQICSTGIHDWSLLLGMLDGNAYAMNFRINIGGKLGFDKNGAGYVGGMAAQAFLDRVIADPNFDHYSIPQLEYAAATPEPGTTATPGPSGPTPVPFDDPLNVSRLSGRYSFLEVHQENKPWNYYHIVREIYMFDGEMMKREGPCSFDLVTEWIEDYVKRFKKENEYAISLSEPFEFEVIEGGEIEKVDVFDADMGVVAGDFDMNGFNALIDANAMVFKTDPDTGKTLPCFAVFLVKLTGHYIEVTGQYEYAEKYVMVPFVP